MAEAALERAWALKRDWTDVGFQGGAEANAAQLREFELQLAVRLKGASGRALEDVDSALALLGSGARAVLEEPEVLGSALDLVGAYLKNYAVDRASAVLEAVMPCCRRRGGLWQLKALNHVSTVRMKQARPEEALEHLREVERLADALGDRADCGEFWETLHRNLGWALGALDREEEAAAALERALEARRQRGLGASWCDLWDLGRLRAVGALRRGQAPELRAAERLVVRALWLQREEEPAELVMRAKLWHSCGECALALGQLGEGAPRFRRALRCFGEALRLFDRTEGRLSPLSGAEAQAAAWASLLLGEPGAAKAPLLQALECLAGQESGWGDGSPGSRAPALAQAADSVDRVLEAHRRTDDRDGLARYFEPLERLCRCVGDRLELCKARTDAAAYERLVSSCAMVMVASGTADGASRSQELLRRHLWQGPGTFQAQLCNEMLLALPAGGPGTAG